FTDFISFFFSVYFKCKILHHDASFYHHENDKRKLQRKYASRKRGKRYCSQRIILLLKTRVFTPNGESTMHPKYSHRIAESRNRSCNHNSRHTSAGLYCLTRKPVRVYDHLNLIYISDRCRFHVNML
uniref:Secreted protein n=1 Tax=Ascaris lumbricoides TaxID=6252 RepID=A0A0M3I942_ASCLU